MEFARLPFWKVLHKEPGFGPTLNSPFWLRHLTSICSAIQASTQSLIYLQPEEELGVTTGLVQLFGIHNNVVNVPVDANELENPNMESFFCRSQANPESEADCGNDRELSHGTQLLAMRSYIATIIAKVEATVDNATGEDATLKIEDIQKLTNQLSGLVDNIDCELIESVTGTFPLNKNRRWENMDTKEKIIVQLLSVINVNKKHLFGVETITFFDYLSDILGLRRETGRKIFQEQSDVVINHHGLEHLTLRYFEDLELEIFEGASTKDNFCHLGFVKGRAQYLADIFHSIEGHLSVVDLACRFVSGLFSCDPLLTEAMTSFPLNPVLLDQPYIVECRTDGKSEKEVACFTTRKNVAGEGVTILNQTILNVINELPEPGYSNWYHGTSIGAFNNIKKTGIRVEAGSPARDFSDLKGFYLSNDSAQALRHLRTFASKQTVVMKFRIPDSFLESHNGLRLSLNSPSDMAKWKEVIRHFRSRLEYGGDELESLDYIVGPVSHDGTWTPANSGNPDWPRVFNLPWLQLCVKSNAAGKQLGGYLDTVIILEPAQVVDAGYGEA